MENKDKHRIVTRVSESTLLWVDSKARGMSFQRSKILKKMINEHKMCESLTGKSVWQIIKDNIELRKKLNE
jgi:hypothetical protein